MIDLPIFMAWLGLSAAYRVTMLRIGILGGGQLGSMLLQEAANFAVETYVLESRKTLAATLCNYFHAGDIRDYDTVLQFGRKVDVLTIEIEHVNVEALETLEQEGIKVIPRPSVLKVIRDKGLQKQFYADHGIPSAPFELVDGGLREEDVVNRFPIAMKLRTGGYDGKGVAILRSASDISRAFREPSIIEELVDIDKEISVIVARNEAGDTAAFPPVEMVFNPEHNLVDYLISPAGLPESLLEDCSNAAMKVLNAFDSPGIFAVEMFINREGRLYVNETAPRAHNSGHQSIEGNFTSQYNMQMRILQGLPLGDTSMIKPSLMINLIGRQEGPADREYKALNEILKVKGTYIHLYRKERSWPGRKLGHITILGEDREDLLEKADWIRQKIGMT